MKKVLFVFCAFLFTVTMAVAQESETNSGEPKPAEAEPENLEDVEFINYTGPNDVIDSVSAIRAIGAELGKQIVQEEASSLGNRNRYSVVHAVSTEEENSLLDADVFFIGSDASVDHITNLRRIISAYIEAAYSYSEENADNLAVYITAYNAVYRGHYDVFQAKYKSIVMENLTNKDCGLSKNYAEWPGHSQIVIPLKKEGGKYFVDDSVFNDRNVIAYMNDGEVEDTERQLIRYKGLAVEGHFKGNFVTGELSEYITAALGGGAGIEYTLPLDLPVLDIGFSARAEAQALLPKAESIVKGGCDITVSAGAFLRLPFLLGKATAAFQPELSYGVVLHSLNADDADVESFYADQILCLSAGLRLSLPRLEKLELELAPQCAVILEQSDVIFQPGVRFGAIWHFETK